METDQKLRVLKTKPGLLNPTFTPEAEAGKGRNIVMTNTVTGIRGTNQKMDNSPKLLTPKLKKEKNYINFESRDCSPENLSVKREREEDQQVKGRLYTTKTTLSTDIKNMDNFPLKRPFKLAPLELPAEVKEVQMQKIRAMQDEIFLDKQKTYFNVPRRKPTSTDNPAKRDVIKKDTLAENTLPTLKINSNAARGPMPEENPSSQQPFQLDQGNTQAAQAVLSTVPKLKARRSNANNSSLHNTQTNPPQTSTKSRFRHLAKPNENESQSKLSIIQLNRDHLRETTANKKK
ncbi:Hypothetical predicted protein [Pelobates cultripes]|uniref:Uncharacterized protein n=1 Tax=Pelobates cultripes TaxID=61616 RepID=A0AAD1S6P5_PELCU|nr:Hypothetical predicted protein [Pelobates cultripes]